MAVYIHRLVQGEYLTRVYGTPVKYSTSFKGLKWLNWYVRSGKPLPIDKKAMKMVVMLHALRLMERTRSPWNSMRIAQFLNQIR